MGLCVLLRALRVLEEVPASRSTKEEKEVGVGGRGGPLQKPWKPNWVTAQTLFFLSVFF